MKKGEHTYILGIESSCDETSASVCRNGKILSNIIATQSIHTQYGGVVPELASRAHMQNIVPAESKTRELNMKSEVSIITAPVGRIVAVIYPMP